MRDSDTLEVLPPHFELGVLDRYGVNTFSKHQGVRGAFGAILIKLILQELIDGRIQGEWRSRWSADAKSPIQIKAARAIQEEIEFAAAEREECIAARIK